MTNSQKLEFIIEYIKKETGFDVRTRNREKRNMGYRWAYYKVSHSLTSATLSLIGDKCERTHASVLNSIKTNPDESWVSFKDKLTKVCDVVFGESQGMSKCANTALIHNLIMLRSENKHLKSKPKYSLMEQRLLDAFKNLNHTRQMEIIHNTETKLKIQQKFKVA